MHRRQRMAKSKVTISAAPAAPKIGDTLVVKGGAE